MSEGLEVGLTISQPRFDGLDAVGLVIEIHLLWLGMAIGECRSAAVRYMSGFPAVVGAVEARCRTVQCGVRWRSCRAALSIAVRRGQAAYTCCQGRKDTGGSAVHQKHNG